MKGKYVAIFIVLLVIVVGAMIYGYYGAPTFTSTTLPLKPPAQTTDSLPQFNGDVFPLWTGATWPAPHFKTITLGTANFSGAEVVSQPFANITDLAAVSEPFEQYYASKLQAAGWNEDQSLAAGGPGSSMTVYRKGRDVIVLQYHSKFLNMSDHAPAQCPCDLTLSVFSGQED